MFWQGFSVFFLGLKLKATTSKNIDFTKEKLIFSRVRRCKIRQTSLKNSKLEVKIGFWRPKISYDVDFGDQDDDFGGQDGDFGGQEGDFETKNGRPHLARGGSVEWRRLLGKAKSTASIAEHVKIPYAGHP